MKRNLVAVGVVSTLMFLTAALAYAAPHLGPRAGFYVCTAQTVPGSLGSFYVTGVFSANVDSETLHNAWANYVSETYHIPKDHAISESLCMIFPDKEDAERGRSNFIARHPAGDGSKGTVSVDWAYSAGR
jgi:hypothetical protein